MHTKLVFFAVIASIILPVGFPARAYPNPIAIKAYRAFARTILRGVVLSSFITYALTNGASIPDQYANEIPVHHIYGISLRIRTLPANFNVAFKSPIIEVFSSFLLSNSSALSLPKSSSKSTSAGPYFSSVYISICPPENDANF